MSSKNPYFWEDYGQARERLNGTYILHGEDIILVEDVLAPEKAADVPNMAVRRFPKNAREYLKLDDPKLWRFRRLPPIGWVNFEQAKEAVHLERRPVRRTSHGLNDNNVVVQQVLDGGRLAIRDYRFRSVAPDEGYRQAVVGDYPTLKDVLENVRDRSTLAIESRYAVHKDSSGVKWLFRNTSRVGMFASDDHLILLGRFGFLREELAEAPSFTINNIQGF